MDRVELQPVIDQVAEIAGFLWEKGWAERNGGNISYNITRYAEIFDSVKPLGQPVKIGLPVPFLVGSYFIVTGTGKRMRYIHKDPMDNCCIIRICPDAESYEIIADKWIKPTSELPSHLAIHNYLQNNRSAYKAIIHTHPTELVAMSHHSEFLKKDKLTKILWSMIPETRAFCPKGLGIVNYKLPGSVELAMSTIRELDEYDVVLWEKHGVLAVGENAIEAFDMIDTLNKSAMIYKDACSMGFTPEGMTNKQMNEIKTAFNL